MIELYQFEMSHYSEKVRLILDYKELAYKKIEVIPGVGQLDLYRLSGQRQVPVIKDGKHVIGDSTAIAKYLERTYPSRPLIPVDPKQKALCFMMEEWADQSIGLKGRTALIGTFSKNADFRKAILPNSTPSFLKDLVGAVPGDMLSILGSGVGFGPDDVKEAIDGLRQDLEVLSTLLVDQPFLMGDAPTLADFAVAGLSMYLKFPMGSYLNIPDSLKGQGVPGLIDDPAYQPFWEWRDRIYADYRSIAMPSATSTKATSNSGPTRIDID